MNIDKLLRQLPLLFPAVPYAFSFLVEPSQVINARALPQTRPLTVAPLAFSSGDRSVDSLVCDAAPALLLVHHPEATSSALSLTPTIGSSLIMLTIVGLLYIWEESVEWIRETVPKALLPVVESILAEIGGLGFIWLFLSTVLGNYSVKENLEGLSIRLFGQEEMLVESFEFLHAAFFQVGIGFFLAAGAMTAVGLKKLSEIRTVEGLELDKQTGACTVTTDKLVKYIPKPNGTQVPDEQSSGHANNLWEDIIMGKEERAARSLLLRMQIMKMFPHLPDTFRVETILQASFAQNLYDIVKISPLTWIYIVPALALANSIDLSHDDVNAASPNAFNSAGYFFSTPSAVVPSAVSVVVSSVWGLWNGWKLTQIKYMLIPRLSHDLTTGQNEIIPALVDSQSKRESFSSSPAWVQPIERVWGKPATNPFEELFGTSGAAGMKLYQNSIKYQTWLSLTHIVFFGTQIVPRDINAIATGATAGDPEHLTAELVTYGGFVLISLLQLLLVAPRTFWNYCLISGLEEKNLKTLLVLSGNVPVPETLGVAAVGVSNSTFTSEVIP